MGLSCSRVARSAIGRQLYAECASHLARSDGNKRRRRRDARYAGTPLWQRDPEPPADSRDARSRSVVRQGEARGALDVDVETGVEGAVLRVVGKHLGLSARERRTQIRALIAAFDTPRMPVILVGDINEWFVWAKRSACS